MLPIKNTEVVYLPKATETLLGVIKVGDGLAIDNEGVLSVDPAIPADITSLEGRMTTAESDIDTAEADIIALQDEIGNMGAILDIINGEVI